MGHWSPGIRWIPAIRWSIRSLDFDNRKVYGDTSITDGLVNVITVIKFSRTSFNRRCAICKFYWVQIYHINRSCLATDGEEKQQSFITFLYPAVLCNYHVQTLKEVASQQTRRRSQIVAQFFTEHQNLVGQQPTCHVGRPRIVEVAQQMSLCERGEAVPRSPVPALISQQMGFEKFI